MRISDWSSDVCSSDLIQLNVNRGDGFNGFLNAGNARSKGFEVEANGRIGEQLRFGGQVTYTDAALRSVRPGVTVAAPGMRLPDIARWTMAGNAEWGTSVGETGYAYVRGDVQYVGPRPSELRSEEHTSELQSLMRISSAGFCLK